MLNEQLKELIKREADALYDHLNEKAQEVDSYDFGLPMANRQTQPIVECLSQYAEKWQEAEADRIAVTLERDLLKLENQRLRNTIEEIHQQIISLRKEIVDMLTPKLNTNE